MIFSSQTKSTHVRFLLFCAFHFFPGCNESLLMQSGCEQSPVVLNVGEDLILYCNVSKISDSIWIKGDQYLFLSKVPLTTIENVKIGDNDYSLYLKNATLRDAGIYQCKQKERQTIKYCVVVLGKFRKCNGSKNQSTFKKDYQWIASLSADEYTALAFFRNHFFAQPFVSFVDVIFCGYFSTEIRVSYNRKPVTEAIRVDQTRSHNMRCSVNSVNWNNVILWNFSEHQLPSAEMDIKTCNNDQGIFNLSSFVEVTSLSGKLSCKMERKDRANVETIFKLIFYGKVS